MLYDNCAIRTCLMELNKSNLIKFITKDTNDRLIRIITKLTSKQKREDLMEIMEFAGLVY